MREWAEMLERRVAQLDPDYEAFHWGGRDEVQVMDARGLLVLPNAVMTGPQDSKPMNLLCGFKR